MQTTCRRIIVLTYYLQFNVVRSEDDGQRDQQYISKYQLSGISQKRIFRMMNDITIWKTDSTWIVNFNTQEPGQVMHVTVSVKNRIQISFAHTGIPANHSYWKRAWGLLSMPNPDYTDFSTCGSEETAASLIQQPRTLFALMFIF